MDSFDKNWSVLHCPLCEEKGPSEKEDPNKHWIWFKIQDESGNGVPNVKFSVILPDGITIEEVHSDMFGMVLIKNLDPGTCKIKTDWRKVKIDDTVII